MLVCSVVEFPIFGLQACNHYTAIHIKDPQLSKRTVQAE